MYKQSWMNNNRSVIVRQHNMTTKVMAFVSEGFAHLGNTHPLQYDRTNRATVMRSFASANRYLRDGFKASEIKARSLRGAEKTEHK